MRAVEQYKIFWCEPEANMDLRGDSHQKNITMRVDWDGCRDGWGDSKGVLYDLFVEM